MNTSYPCTCENCNRSHDQISIVQVNINEHISYLCKTCAYVLKKPQNEQRLLQMTRKKTKYNANAEMKKVHQTLSALIGIGIFFLVVVVGLAVAQNIDFTPKQIADIPVTEEYLSFLFLNK